MKKLFIIGNGFDRAHDLPTRYLDYREFLSANPETRDFLMRLEQTYNLSASDEIWWENFEDNLGDGWAFEMDFENMAYSVMDNMVDDEGESMPDVQEALYTHFRPYYEFMDKLNETVLKWVRTIDFARKSRITRRISSSDTEAFYFTFNYTDVLEDLYGINYSKVFHVHGSASEGRVIMGHGNVRALERFRLEAEAADAKADKNLVVLKEGIYSFYKATYKDTKMLIRQNRSVFDSYRGVGEVYVYGHSMGEVDKPYYLEIKKRILPDADWFIYIYCEREDFAAEKAEWIRKTGFLHINRKHLHILPVSKF